MIRSVNVRALKDKLSAYLRDVQRGDVVLVSDRGRIIAELRSPTLSGEAIARIQPRRIQLVEAGVLRTGLPNSADAYPPADIHLDARVVDDALRDARANR